MSIVSHMDYSRLFSEDTYSFFRSPVRDIFKRVDLNAIHSFAGGYPSAETFPLELELHRLDCIACHGIMDGFVFLLDELRRAPEQAVLPDPLVMGRDLVAAGRRPGRCFRPVLDAIYDRQLAGEFGSREEALASALSLLDAEERRAGGENS